MTDRPPDALSIAVAQLNPVMGDIAGNLELARAAYSEAAALGADLLVLTELFLCGYPPEDLVLKPAVQAACREAAETLALETRQGPGIVVGAPWVDDYAASTTARSFSTPAELPRSATRWSCRTTASSTSCASSSRGRFPGPLAFRGVRLGLPVCEDIWLPDVTDCLSETGAELLIVPNGSPYWSDKSEERMQIAVARVVETGLPILFANQVGGQDELVFDGGSFGLNGDRTLGFQMPQFQTGVALTRWERGEAGWRCIEGPMAKLPSGDSANWQACVLGLRDYVEKNGFKGVVLGLSGGIDSAVAAAMAVDALGPARVRTVMLPYRYTADGEPRRRGRMREAPRGRARRAADRAGGRGLRGDA